jgi:predicted flap endonuclease-1-like 5' DNA nuclease
VDLVGRIDAASERSSGSAPGSSEPASASVTAAPPPPDEATVALDVFALVGRIDATTDAGDDDGEDDPPPAPPRELAFADASATIQQQRPSFLEGEDLKILKGVGPVIELRMREFGITSWRSLADLDEDGLDRLADHLKMTPERVRPWADQARGLTASDVASDDPSEAP